MSDNKKSDKKEEQRVKKDNGYIHTCINTNVHTYMHTYVCTYMHTNISTDTAALCSVKHAHAPHETAQCASYVEIRSQFIQILGQQWALSAQAHEVALIPIHTRNSQRTTT